MFMKLHSTVKSVDIMTNYDIYILVVALSVFFIFTLVFGVMVSYMVKTAVKLIRYGDDDKTILKERK